MSGPRRWVFAVLAFAALGVYGVAASLFWLPPIHFPESVVLANMTPAACRDAALRAPGSDRQAVLFVSLSAVPESLLQQLFQHEDAFYHHRGVDWVQMWRALGRNLVAGRYQFGGGTLTMQLMRELFLGKQRTLLRKLREVAYALQAERRLSKREILEMYLNVVHWGPGIRGVGAAACHYFGVPPSALGPDAARQLVAVLPDPEHLGPVLRRQVAGAASDVAAFRRPAVP